MKNRVNQMKKLYADFRKGENERGVVAVIVALILVALMGFASLAIDESAWLVKQRQYQNAVDAIALDACDKKYRTKNKNRYSDEQIYNDAIELARKNGIEFDPADVKNQLVITYSESEKKATATISKPTDNYFLVAVNGKTETNIKVTSDAQLGGSSTPGSLFAYNSAIESKKNIDWNNGSVTTNIDGGVSCEGKFTSTSKGTYNGSIWANEGVDLQNVLSLSGNIYTEKDFYTNSGIHFNGNVYAKGSVRSVNDSAEFKEVHSRSISIAHKSDYVQSEHEFVDDAQNVKHYTWYTTWKTLEDHIKTRKNNGEYFVVNEDSVKAYLNDHPDSGLSWDSWNRGIVFDNRLNFADFYNYCVDKYKTDNGGKEPLGIYVEGSITNNAGAFTLNGNIIADGSITRFLQPDSIMNGSLISMNGDIITLGGTINNGGLIALGGKIDCQNKQIEITGAVSARDGISVTQAIKVHGNTKWATIVDPSESSEKVRLSK